MSRYCTVRNADGRRFTARIVRPGDRYGLHYCQVSDRDEPMVEFYVDSPHDEDSPLGMCPGAFYCLSTLRGEDSWSQGPVAGRALSLQADVPEWTLDGSCTEQVMRWVEEELERERPRERFVQRCAVCGFEKPTEQDDHPDEYWQGELCDCGGEHGYVRRYLVAEEVE